MLRSVGLVTVVYAAAWCPTPVAAQQKPVEQQIAEAVTPLPDADRDGARVLAFTGGELPDVVREGSNHYVCLADKPGDDRFQVSCYHESLEPFMARGRELAAAGHEMRERRRIRGEEIAAGVLPMPELAALLTLRGRIKPGAAVPDTVSMTRVIYLPFATVESTGFPARPGGRGQPWLMEPGQHRTHVMIPGERIPFRVHRGSRD